MAREDVRMLCLVPANDEAEQPRQEHLYAALRLFAAHGIGAAKFARGKAMIAARQGERARFDEWFAICRALDRRMATRLALMAEKTG